MSSNTVLKSRNTSKKLSCARNLTLKALSRKLRVKSKSRITDFINHFAKLKSTRMNLKCYFFESVFLSEILDVKLRCTLLIRKDFYIFFFANLTQQITIILWFCKFVFLILGWLFTSSAPNPQTRKVWKKPETKDRKKTYETIQYSDFSTYKNYTYLVRKRF